MSSLFVGASSWVLDPTHAAGFIAARDVAMIRLGERLDRLGLVPDGPAETHGVMVGGRFLLVAVAPAWQPVPAAESPAQGDRGAS